MKENESRPPRNSRARKLVGAIIVVGIAASLLAIAAMTYSLRKDQSVEKVAPLFVVHDLVDVNSNVVDVCWVGSDKVALSIHEKVLFLDAVTGSVLSSAAVEKTGYDLRAAVADSQLVVGDAIESVIIDAVSLEKIVVFDGGLLPYVIHDDWLLVGKTNSGVIAWDMESCEYLPLFESIEEAKDSDSLETTLDKVAVISNASGTRIHDAKDFHQLEVVFINDRLDFRKRTTLNGETVVAKYTYFSKMVPDATEFEFVNLESKKVLARHKVKWHGEAGGGGEFSPDGRFFAIPRIDYGNLNKVVDLIDPLTGTKVGECGSFPCNYVAMAWSPDSSKLALVSLHETKGLQLAVFEIEPFLEN